MSSAPQSGYTAKMQVPETLRVGLLQIEPVWLRRDDTLARIAAGVEDAAAQGCGLVATGEALAPGYPFWVELSDGARFDDERQKQMFAWYAREAVVIESAQLEPLRSLARMHRLAIVLGVIERAPDRGGHSLYCSRVFIDASGRIASVHRKLIPTYEERLVWAPGDGAGLQVHPVGAFTVGALNCWENWMPLARTALYAQGENLHVAIWPGNVRNTQDLTRMIAQEARSYVISVSGLLHRDSIDPALPVAAAMREQAPPWLANGGSCVAAPDGSWVLPPVVEQSGVFCVDLDLDVVRGARQNFDPVGHYSRPDVLRLSVDRRRQRSAQFIDAPTGQEDNPAIGD